MKRRDRPSRTPLAEQGRIARRMASRAQGRRRDHRLDPVDHCLLSAIDERTLLGYGDGRIGCRVLAELVGRTTRTVRRHLARLEALGYLEIGERQHGHGGPAVNRYRVLSPKDWTGRARDERARGRAARDAARKRRGGVLTRVTPALTRGRVNTRSGTGEQSGVARPSRTEADKRTRKGHVMHRRRMRATEAQTRRELEERWERMAATAERVEPVMPPGVERAAAEEDEARGRVAELVARAQAAQARRLGVGPGAPWERGAA